MDVTTVAANELTVWQVHRGHIVLLAVWLAIVAGVLAWSKLSAARTRRRDPANTAPLSSTAPPAGAPHPRIASRRLRRDGWLWAAVAATVLSAAIHLDVIGEHFAESALYGTFFLVLAAAQFGWAGWLVARPTVVNLSAGAAASLGVALLWLATRTVGIPVGVAAGEREAFGAIDVVASAAELAVALFAVAAVLVVRGARGRRVGLAGAC